MQRINLHSGRLGYDGDCLNWEQIEAKFIEKYEQSIFDNIDELIRTSAPQFQPLLTWCRLCTSKWLIAKPLELKIVRDIVESTYKGILKDNKNFRNDLEKAYGYDHAKLTPLSNWLNVKTCPYCNMHYTLYAEEYVTKRKKKKMAKFQFDHFYNKYDYPMLSMSLYNLIPSCASCNQGKAKGELPLDFHPYHAAIGSNFTFEVKNPIPLLIAKDEEKLEVELVKRRDCELDKYNKMFHIEALYQRHMDVARDVFARAYVDSYYGNWANFAFLEDQELAERISKGFYPNEDEIELRPMTKFQQDLWAQAKGTLKELVEKSE